MNTVIRMLKQVRHLCLPHDSHELPSNNRIAPVRANAKIEVLLQRFTTFHIVDAYCTTVKVYRLNFVTEKHADVSCRQSLAEQVFIQERAVD